MFLGMKVVVTAMAVKQLRNFPERRRSGRLHKKLCKRFCGEFRQAPAAFKVGGMMFVHPVIWAKMRAEIR